MVIETETIGLNQKMLRELMNDGCFLVDGLS